MKKAIFCFMILAMLVILSTVCEKKPIVYSNETLGFSIVLPSNWYDKYQAVGFENGVNFYQSGTVKKYGYGSGRLFSIVRRDGILDKEKAEDTPWPTHFLMHANGFTYVMSMPSDQQAPMWGGGSIRLTMEYNKMFKKVEQIRQSIAAIP